MPGECVPYLTSIAGTCNCFAGARLLVSECGDLSQFSDHDRNRLSMTPNTSMEALGRNFEPLVELEDERLRDTHLAECYEASYRPSRTPSKAGAGAHGTKRVQQIEVQRAPSRIEDLNRDSFLPFRDVWVRNRARDIQRTGSISFHTCSDDTASITALNEFYRWRVFDGFKAEHRDEEEVEIGMMQGSRDFGNVPKEVTSAEKIHMCRIGCRGRGRRAFRKTCSRRAKSQV
jgi:hypothetical protein